MTNPSLGPSAEMTSVLLPIEDRTRIADLFVKIRPNPTRVYFTVFPRGFSLYSWSRERGGL